MQTRQYFCLHDAHAVLVWHHDTSRRHHFKAFQLPAHTAQARWKPATAAAIAAGTLMQANHDAAAAALAQTDDPAAGVPMQPIAAVEAMW
jgi:hypothetical protein